MSQLLDQVSLSHHLVLGDVARTDLFFFSPSFLVSPFQDESQEVKKLQKAAAVVLYFLSTIALHQSLGIPPKRTTSPSAVDLLSHRLLPLLRELGGPTLLDPDLGYLRAACYLLANLLAGSSPDYEVNVVKLRWWRCEAGIVGECQKLEEGEEMMACGRVSFSSSHTRHLSLLV